tara:strand:- start:43 stop:213 length:171 start_codon:yes stop_codon:yes gene_type:complete
MEIFKNRMTVKEARKALVELVEFETDDEKMSHYRKLEHLDDEALVEYAKEVAENMK